MCTGFEIVITAGPNANNRTMQTDEVRPKLQPPNGTPHCASGLPVPRFSPPCVEPVYYNCNNNPQELGFISHLSPCCQIKSICGNFLNVSRWFRIICCFVKAPTLMLRKSTNTQTMSGYSHREINDQPLCLSSHSYSFSQSWRNESSHFTESAVKTSDPCGPPAHFDSGTSQHNKAAPYLFMSVDTVEPPTITWYMWLNLQVCVSSFSSPTPDTGCQEKQLPFSRNNSSVALLRDGVEGPGKVSPYCPPTDPGTYSCKSNKGVCPYASETCLPDCSLIKPSLTWPRVKLSIHRIPTYCRR